MQFNSSSTGYSQASCLVSRLGIKFCCGRIVNKSLAGRTQALKEIVLAKDVFGRSDYDPRRHTLVRVEVNAVRRKLAEYYTKFGSEDQVHIDIPRGHYVATFSSLPPTRPGHRWRRGWYAIAASTIIVVSAVVVLLATRRSPLAPTGVPVQITFDTGWTSQPAVSRDGSVLVYASDRGSRGNTDIWIHLPGKPPRLTNDPAHATNPDMSPEGKRVVFRSWRKPEGIWSISADVFAAKDTKGAHYDLSRIKVADGRRKQPARPLGVQAQLRARSLPAASHWPQQLDQHTGRARDTFGERGRHGLGY
jgi:hypothetical protein